MMRHLLLVRHTEVARRWRGRCYGTSDAGLSRVGTAHAVAIAPQLAAWRPDIVIHSDRRRTRDLARRAAALAGVNCRPDAQWRERDFGEWEGRTWNAIYRATGNAMDGMIDAPDSFRPGGGETTTEMLQRIALALSRLPGGRVAVVTHGGPVAAARWLNAGLAVSALPALIPGYGETWEMAQGGLR
ncbi:MAG: histidine phosphatase family protein [Sandarakinorhabdus sp.]|nr:histidine phosphatase family protein [Sandarakinorhabdus sp.]